MRAYGLRGLHSYICMTEDLDNLIARFVDKNHDRTQVKLLPIFLENMQYKDGEAINSDKNINNDIKETSISKLGTLCLKDMAARVNHITVRPLCESMLDYLDEKKLWEPNDFAIEAIKSLSIGVPPQLNSTIIRFLLEHLDKKGANEVSIKTNIVDCIEKIMPQSISQQVSEVLSSIVRQMIVPEGKIDGKLSKACISCISTITDRQVDALHQLDVASDILQYFSNSISDYSKMALCEVILNITEKMKPLQKETAYPPSFIERLCSAGLDSNPDVRKDLLTSLHRVLRQTDILQRISKNVANVNTSTFKYPYEIYISQILSALLSHVQKENNSPKHYHLIFQIYQFLIRKLGLVGTIAIIPQIFYIQAGKYTNSQGPSAHMLVLGLFCKIADLRGLDSLSTYISSIYQKRKAAKELSDSVSVNLDKAELYIAMNDYTDDCEVKNLFDKEKVIETLSDDNELSSCDWPTLLEKEVSFTVSSPGIEDDKKMEERRQRMQNAIGISQVGIDTLSLNEEENGSGWEVDAFCKYHKIYFFE